jgi:hypothetical protein
MKSYHSLSKTLAFHAATSNVSLGNAGERLAIALFKDNGYKAKKQQSLYAGDIEVFDPKTGCIFRIEVKTARESVSRPKTWQFCLNKKGFTSSAYSHYCLFFAVQRGKVSAYLVPEKFIGSRKSFTLTNPDTYAGMLKKFDVSSGVFTLENQDLIAWMAMDA